ncbi:MAG: hypothetical protein J1F32_01910 [Erysipelotrichales bacterium]|nr:hypothetical protein [Erysipelotrichales bacterium]
MQEVYMEAKKKKKKFYPMIFAMLFGFFMVCLLTVVLNILFPAFVIVLFPLLILPYFIAMQMTLIQLDVQEFSRKNFYRLLVVGLSPMIRRSFRVLKNALLACLIYFLAMQVSMFIFGLIPEYSELMTELTKSIALNGSNINNVIDTITNNYQNNELWTNMIFISSSIAYGLAFMFFVYKMLHNALYALCKTSASLPDGKDQPIFKEVFKRRSRAYYKTYYKNEWYKVVLVPLFYILGVVLAYFLERKALNLVFGISFSLVAIVILLPSLMLYQEKTYASMFEELSKRNFTNMQKVYSDIKGQANLSEEQEKALEDFMNQLENAMKEKNEQGGNDNKENKSSDE